MTENSRQRVRSPFSAPSPSYEEHQCGAAKRNHAKSTTTEPKIAKLKNLKFCDSKLSPSIFCLSKKYTPPRARDRLQKSDLVIITAVDSARSTSVPMKEYLSHGKPAPSRDVAIESRLITRLSSYYNRDSHIGSNPPEGADYEGGFCCVGGIC
jgi:hypothetical protein